MPSFTARSTTGTTLPRRLNTPRTHAGMPGTRVTVSCSMISFTLQDAERVLLPGEEKLRYCVDAAGVCCRSWSDT